jgi:hypothetical protein
LDHEASDRLVDHIESGMEEDNDAQFGHMERRLFFWDHNIHGFLPRYWAISSNEWDSRHCGVYISHSYVIAPRYQVREKRAEGATGSVTLHLFPPLDIFRGRWYTRNWR